MQDALCMEPSRCAQMLSPLLSSLKFQPFCGRLSSLVPHQLPSGRQAPELCCGRFVSLLFCFNLFFRFPACACAYADACLCCICAVCDLRRTDSSNTHWHQTHNHSLTHWPHSWKVYHCEEEDKQSLVILSVIVLFGFFPFLLLPRSICGSSAHTDRPIAGSLIDSQRSLRNPPVANATKGHRVVTDRLRDSYDATSESLA